MIDRINGIKYYIYDNDHPPAHYHAYYVDEAVVIDIEMLLVIEGNMRPAKLREAIAWGKKNQALLRQDFDLKNPPTHQKK